MGRTVVIDAENVRRSVWPNVGREELVGLAGAYARDSDVDVVVVFDGSPPVVDLPSRVTLEGRPGSSADDLIVSWVTARGGAATVVATSDRGLRERLPGAVGTIGGGRLLRLLLELRE